jgi:hypothetical protein
MVTNLQGIAPPLAEAIALARDIEDPEEWQVVDRSFALGAASPQAAHAMPVLVAVETLGALVATRSFDAAGRLLATLERWISAAGPSVLSADAEVRFAIARDLVRLAAALRPGPAAQIARHAIRGRFDPAAEVLANVVARDHGAGARALAVLEESTSLLAPRLREGLARGAKAHTRAVSAPPGVLRLVQLAGCAVVLLFGIVLVLFAVIAIGTFLTQKR